MRSNLVGRTPRSARVPLDPLFQACATTVSRRGRRLRTLTSIRKTKWRAQVSELRLAPVTAGRAAA